MVQPTGTASAATPKTAPPKSPAQTPPPFKPTTVAASRTGTPPAKNAPTAGQPNAAPPPGTPDSARIHTLLSDEGTLGLDRNDHLHQVADILKRQPPGQLNRTLAGLSDADMKSFGDQINSQGWFGAAGLSKDERNSLYGSVAKDGDGTQLARLAKNLQHDDGILLTAQMAGNTQPAAKVDFVTSMASADIKAGSTAAIETGTVLASLRGGNFDAGAKALRQPQLEAIAQSGIIENPAHSWINNTSLLPDLVDAAASSNDPAVKGHVFEAGATTFKNMAGADSLHKRTADALTSVLHTDATGIMGRLNTEQPEAGAMRAYMKEMVAQHRDREVGETIKQLMQGNDLSQQPSSFLDRSVKDPNGREYYQNSRSLGYAVGSLVAAIKSTNSDIKTQGDRVTNILNTVVSFAAVSANPAGKEVAQIVNGLTKEIVGDVVASMQAGNKNVQDALLELTMPRDPTTHEPVQLASSTDYKATVGYIASVN